MTETQRRIQAYKKALPHMKERVMAVVLLLAMSVTMLASASFAWITLSKAPEVSGLATTVTTNGNLEIALSDADGREPDPTAVGDGGQVVTLSNLTWGNLINLSDPSYGLEDITLRPAVLNSGSLKDSPLYAVTYGADGRIDDIALDFAFTNYQQSQIEGASGSFIVPDNGTQYGVRAISSVKADSAGANADLMALSNNATRSLAKAVLDFQTLYGNKEYINSITKLAGVYITYRIDDTDQDCSSYITPLYNMMNEFGGVLDQVGQTLLAVANLQHYLYCDKLNSDEDPANNLTYRPFTLEQVGSGTATDSGTGGTHQISLNGNAVYEQLKAEGFQDTSETLTALKLYVNARQQFASSFSSIETLYKNYTTAGKTVSWEALRDSLNIMANIYTTTIDGIETQAISASNATSLAGGTKECIVHSGLLVDMDQLLGTNMAVKGVSATVKVIITVTVNANVTTAAQNNPPYQLVEAVNLAKEKASGGASSLRMEATDTYGLVIDFWVRTNAADSLLMLEGEMVTRTVELTDSEGNVVLDDDGNPVTQTIVVGYKGANRVWEEDDPGLPVLGTSTTQGSGSCYVFYPESPEDQDQSLKLLQAMCVAFIGVEKDENGKEKAVLLAQADMDTANAYEEAGRVLVPLKLRAKTVESNEPELDENGDIVYNADGSIKYKLENSYHIMELEQNKAERITAVVYMDGSRLTNSEVLASSSIHGQMNIQFGTSEDITSMDEKDLKESFYNITISADQTEFGAYDADNKPVVNLTLGVTGTEPKSIRGNFVSYISSTQGAKQPTFDFVKGENGWTAAVPLNGAGTYQLRSVQIDGVDYILSAEQIEALTITVQGTTVNSVSCENWNGNSFSYKSADSYYTVKMTTEVSGVVPKKVQGVFVHNEGQNVTVNFNLTNNGWEATGMFTTSGTYKMTYMIVDGSYVPLAESQHKTLSLQLGLSAQVFISAPVNAAYKELEEDLAAATTEEERTRITGEMESLLEALYSDEENCLNLQQTAAGYTMMYSGSEELFMEVSCIITDDKGNVMTTLNDVDLYYGIGTSQLNRLTAENMTWNADKSRFEGEFVMSRPGYYSFQLVNVDGSQITRASSAPSIQAISPTPIEYVGKSESYVSNVEEIGRSDLRYLDVVLSEAPSAVVALELTHTDDGLEPTKYLFTPDGTLPNYVDEAHSYAGVLGLTTITDMENDIYTYRAMVPTDGTWTVTGMMVSGVFYKENGNAEGVFYDGVVGEGGTGWLDFTNKVVASNISTDFFTTVNFSANKQPNARYEGSFMEDHKVEGMVLTLTDYRGNALENVSVTLQYVWNDTGKFSANSTSLPNKSFGGTLTSADGKTFAMPEMNFQLAGSYHVSFMITINGQEYTNIQAFTVPANGGFEAMNVDVEWKTLPSVTITAISPNGSGFAVDEITSGTTNDTGDCDSKKQAAAHKSAGKHNYVASISSDKKTATVYIACEDWSSPGDNHNCAPAEVTLTLEAVTGVTAAQLSFGGGSSSTPHIYKNYGTSATSWDADTTDQTSTYEWSSGSGECMRYIGKISGAYGTNIFSGDTESDAKVAAGTLRSSNLTLTYGGIQYTVSYPGITINNPY